jgi:uncharacterized protein (TIGR04255 family)
MIPTRHRYKLHQDPLMLVLCQVRFSRIRKMRDFLPDIQDRLRRIGFPEDASTTLQRIRFEPGKQPELVPTPHDEFRSKDGAWGVVLGEDMLALATTCYDRYHGFAGRLGQALEIVDQVAALREGSVLRLGLRYVDVIAPVAGESWRDYLRPSLHGPTSEVFQPDQPFINLEYHGETPHGRMTLRINQNNQQGVVPPDAMVQPMKFRRDYPEGQLLTLVDTDHYLEKAWDFSIPDLLEALDHLHQDSNKVLFDNLITEHALQAWGAERVADPQT